jgi:type IV pilus assembly protein PilF
MKRFKLVFIVLALVLSGCATPGPTGKVLTLKQLKEMGEKYIAAGDTANALKYLTEAEQKKPDDPLVQYDLGLAYNQRGLPDKSIAHFQQALKLKPSYPEAFNAMGAVYADRGQIELAQEAFQKALNDPFYQTPQYAAYNLAKLLDDKDDSERALAMYQQAVRFDPAYGLAWYRIGTILEKLRRGDEARNAYGKAVSATPDLTEAHLRYGVMCYQTGNMEAAIFSLSRVLKLAPNTSMADEARSYLGKLKGVIAQNEARMGASSAISPADIEVFSNQELQRQQVQQQQPPPRPAFKEQPAPMPKSTAPTVKMTPLPAPPENPAPTTTDGFVPAPREAVPPESKESPAAADPAFAARVQPPSIQEQQFNFIVQLGSFVDKEKAAEMKDRLQGKGYSAIVKSVKHHVLGSIYVIQLKPVNSFSKASTLMTQLGSEVEGEPVIIKVPIAPKPVPMDLTPPQEPAPAP